MKTQTTNRTNAQNTFQSIQESIQKRIEKGSNATLIVGLLIIALGIISLYYPYSVGSISTMAIGGIIIVSGIFRFAFAIFSYSVGSMIMRYLFSIIMIIAGVWIFSNPEVGLEGLTMFMAIYFIIDGITSMAYSFTLKANGVGIYMLIGGAISTILGALIFSQWPESSKYVLGIYVGVKLIIDGLMLTTTSLLLKKSSTQY